MKDKSKQTAAILRQMAEEELANKSTPTENYYSDIAILKLVHELEVHKIELEMQNEELIIGKNNAKANAKKFTNLYDFAPSGYFTLSKDGEIKELNFRCANLLGKERSLLLNKRFASFISDNTRSIFNKFLEELFETKTIQTCEISLTNPSFYVILSGIISEDGEQFLVTMDDISQIKKVETEIKISEEKYRTLFESNRDSITIFRLDKEGKPGLFIEANPVTKSIFGYSKKDLLALSVADIEIDSDEKRKERLAILLSEGKVNFETIIKNKKGDHINVDVETLVINYLNEPAVMNISRDITERKQNEENTRKAQENLLSILKAIPDMLFEVDLEGKIYYYQGKHDNLLAVPQTDFLGKKFQDLIPVEAANVCFEALNEALNKGWSTGKQYSLQLTEGTFWFELSVSPIKEGNILDNHFIILVRDITVSKVAEEKLRDEKERIRTILEMVVSPIFLKDNDHKITYANSAFCNLFGLDEKSVIGKTLTENVPKDEMEHFLKTDRTVLDTGVPDSREEKLTQKGVERTFITSKTRFVDESGNKSLVGSIFDITERKQAEEALKNEKRRLAVILIGTGAGTWEWNIQTGETVFNEQWANIFGYTLEELAPVSIDTWVKFTHPDDLKYSAEKLEKHFKGELDYYECEARMKHKNGDWIWVLDRGRINEWDVDGKPLLMSGTHLDITEKKIAENTLYESEEKYRNLVENSPDGVVIYIEDKIAFINEEGVRMLGAKNKDEILGKPVLQFIHPDSVEDVVKRMKEILTDNYISKSVEEKFMRLDGTPFNVEVKGIPTLYEHKEGVQIIVHDITERKRSTLLLNKINRVYALISQINTLIIVTHNQEELFQEICNIAVDFGKFRMSWIGLVNDEHKILTAAFAGYEEGYFTKSNITTTLDVPKGRGPTGIALREGRTVICNDITKDKMMKPWRKDALERGYSSMISIPIIVRNKIIGAFNLYSEERNFFSSEEEITLLEKIILNISFALEKIQVEEDRKKTEDKIRQLSQAVEQSPVSIVITNTFSEIEYVNPKFIETTGYTLEETIGKNPRFLKSGHTSLVEYKELWQTIVSGKEWHGEFHNKRKDGTLFWESASISPIVNTEGKTTHFIAIKEDITDRKNVEKELVKSKERAEESDRLKLVFLANMSHEIRTPMNGILGFTELLKAPHISSKEKKEYISIIEKSGKRMLNIINDIISISKVESGQIEISKTETNINEQLEYIYTFFKPEANLKGIDLTLQKILPSGNNYIKTDCEKLYAVLTNLVKNAIKFTNEGSIEIGCEKKGGYLEFFVKDTGLGIPISQKKIIFERFRQANETISRTHEGSGLGLAISKAYVEMLDGRIWVESQEGKGSTFYFTIPFHSDIDHKNDTVVDKAVSIIKEENKVKDLKVLIVEDDAISKLLITIAVKPYSKEILKVSTGFEAIEACRNNPDIDVVMMDINMPEMGGYEATKNIREFNKDLVIIAQTANGMQSDRDNAIAAGCTDYISKPINITDLGALIQKYFKK
jgi:PAS domain S-box-containing protein